MEIELRHLRYFMAVAEEQHFSRAAERLGIAQPPLSQQIQRLEEVVGQKLFERRPRVRLTPAGEVMFESARKLLNQLREDVDLARRTGEGLAGSITIGFPASALMTWLPEAVRTFRERYPDVHVQLRELSSASQVTALAAREIDVAFIRGAVAGDGLACQIVLEEPFVAAIPPSYVLPEGRQLTLWDLALEPFIFFPRTVAPALYDEITELFRAADIRPTITMEALEWLTIVGLEESDIGVSIVPQSFTRLQLGRVRYAALEGVTTRTTLSICTPADKAAAPALNFTALVLEKRWT